MGNVTDLTMRKKGSTRSWEPQREFMRWDSEDADRRVKPCTCSNHEHEHEHSIQDQDTTNCP
jgi:hypothetical protein